MAEHDFRRSALNPSHTLIECRTLAAGLFQVTGQGSNIKPGDTLICTVKGSKNLPLPLQVDKVRYLINPPGQWTAMAKGPDLRLWNAMICRSARPKQSTASPHLDGCPTATITAARAAPSKPERSEQQQLLAQRTIGVIQAHADTNQAHRSFAPGKCLAT